MRILHTISSMGVNSGGPTQSTDRTVRGLRDAGVDAQVLTYDANPGDHLINRANYIHVVPQPKERRFGYSSGYKDSLRNSNCDLYHIQGLWQYPAYITAKTARRKTKPYVITLRGMLYPQALENSATLKKIFLKLFQYRDLMQAACIHTTCEEEMIHLRDMGITAPVAIIPNPINYTQGKTDYVPSDKIRVGFLGRLHKRKNVDRLLCAWADLGNQTPNCELVIIGGGEDMYMDFLRNEVARLSLDNVLFTGFLSGQAKQQALGSLSYLAVPSDFENFGNIITEALAIGVPVIASKGTPWQELNKYDCGWWIDNDIDTLTDTLQKAIALPETMRKEMGERGKKLIEENYTVEIVASKMKMVYDWILNKGVKPDFINE